MSEPTVQDLVESVDALGKTTSELVERYTEAIFGVEVSAGSAAEDAKKTAADRVQTGLDAEFTALKANEAKDSAAQAEQAKLDAQEVTQLSTFKQYRDQAQQGATTSTAQAVIATQKGTLATEQAAIATNKANVATAEATKSTTQAGIATQKAQAASDSERVVLQKAQEVSDNTTLVATHTTTVVRKSDEVVVNAATVVSQTNTVNQKAAEVASNASTVASNTTTTTQKAAEATTAANTSNNNVKLSKEWAVGLTPPAGNTAPSNTNNAMYWAQQAQHNANQTFISGGLFTPTTQTPYPNTTGVVRDTIWLVEFAASSTTFTYTSGQLSGKTVKNGDMIFWDTPENKFNLIPTKLGGILSLVTEWGTEEGPSVDIRGRYLRKSGDSTTSLMSLSNLALQDLKDLNSERVGYFGAEGGAGNYLGNVGRWLRFFAKDALLQVIDQNNAIRRVFHEGYTPLAEHIRAGIFSGNFTFGTPAAEGTRFGATTHKAMVATSANAGEYLFGGNPAGGAAPVDYLRIGPDKLQFETGGRVLNVWHQGVGAIEKKTVLSRPTGAVDGKYYPIVFRGDIAFLQKEIIVETKGSVSSDPMNNCSFRGSVRSAGWSDKVSIVDGLFTIFDPRERAIHSVWGGTENAATFAFYVEARAFPVTVTHNTGISVQTSATNIAEDGYVFNAGVDIPSGTKIKEITNFDKGTGRYFNNSGIVGGGGVPSFINQSSSFTVASKKAYKLDMTDGINKTATVPDGFFDDDWFVISTLEWKRGLTGLAATVQFNTERLTNGEQEFDGYIIDRPCVLYFLKSGGKWTLADGIGVDGSYNALENRVDELEKYPTPWLRVGTTDVDAVRLSNSTVFNIDRDELCWRFADAETIQIQGIVRCKVATGSGTQTVFNLPTGWRIRGDMTFLPATVSWGAAASYFSAEQTTGFDKITVTPVVAIPAGGWAMISWTISVKRV